MPNVINDILGYMAHHQDPSQVWTPSALAEALGMTEEVVARSLANHVHSHKTTGRARIKRVSPGMYQLIGTPTDYGVKPRANVVNLHNGLTLGTVVEVVVMAPRIIGRTDDGTGFYLTPMGDR